MKKEKPSLESRKLSKKELAIILSKLLPIKNPKYELEQYQTPSEIAADIAWAIPIGDEIADLGSGNGILGLALALVGWNKVYLIEKDPEQEEILYKNKELLGLNNVEILIKDVGDLELNIENVIANPPFGHNSNEYRKFFHFIEKNKPKTVYLLWEESQYKKLKKLKDYDIKIIKRYQFPIKPIYFFHTKKKHYINVLFLKGDLREQI